jgi:hypothetical protein
MASERSREIKRKRHRREQALKAKAKATPAAPAKK